MRPFLSSRPLARAPLLVTCEHATNRLPHAKPVSRTERAVLASHWGWDPGAWGVTREISRRLGVTAIGGACTRLLVDLNRAAGDATLIRRHADGVPLSWNRRLSAAEVERRIAQWHAPYHAEIERRIVGHLVRGIRPLVFAVHTFTPELHGSRRDFDVGVLFREHARRGQALGHGLVESGLRVRYNEPYSGIEGMMYSAERHGSHHGLACLELEVNHGILTTDARVGRVAQAVADVLSRIL